MTATLVIPLKGFADAKGRLAEALDPSEREELARHLASGVIAAAPGPVVVVTSDPDAADLAVGLGATALADPGRGLDAAAEAGRRHAVDSGADRVAIVHADLPFPDSLAEVVDGDDLVLVPDRRDDGTNVIVLPSRLAGFAFAYGPGSFARHLAEASRLSISPRVVRDSPLAWDVDLPEDLDTPAEWGSWAPCPS